MFADSSSLSNVDVLVIGMGPTGLGAAKRLNHIVSSSPPDVPYNPEAANASNRTALHGSLSTLLIRLVVLPVLMLLPRAL